MEVDPDVQQPHVDILWVYYHVEFQDVSQHTDVAVSRLLAADVDQVPTHPAIYLENKTRNH